MNPFDQGPAAAAMYDGWYASPIGRRVLEVEAQCVKATLSPTARPWVDVGCGSGRLGELLAVELGLDPAPNLLRLARTRLRNAVRGVAEQLPLADGSIGAAMAVTVGRSPLPRSGAVSHTDQAETGLAATLRSSGTPGMPIIGPVGCLAISVAFTHTGPVALPVARRAEVRLSAGYSRSSIFA